MTRQENRSVLENDNSNRPVLADYENKDAVIEFEGNNNNPITIIDLVTQADPRTTIDSELTINSPVHTISRQNSIHTPPRPSEIQSPGRIKRPLAATSNDVEVNATIQESSRSVANEELSPAPATGSETPQKKKKSEDIRSFY